jgi:hypothetical protein
VFDLTDIDSKVPQIHIFNPSRTVGAHVPYDNEITPADLFKLFFDSKIVQDICDASNEYAELKKSSRSTMYRYYKQMVPEDFYALVGVLVHLGYRKIPRYRLMWSPTSLCFDPVIQKCSVEIDLKVT